MLKSIKVWAKNHERRIYASYSHRIDDPEERKKSEFFFRWHDHAILRGIWHNFSEVCQGVYRSNQPDRDRFADYKARGIGTILNLRGAVPHCYYHFEQEWCAELGLTLIDHQMGAREAPTKAVLTGLLDIFETIEKPFLMHCKSGADRTGLAAALYLLHVEKRSLEEARAQLSFRYLHLKSTKTGVLDQVLDLYEAESSGGEMSIREWVETHYDEDKTNLAFQNRRKK